MLSTLQLLGVDGLVLKEALTHKTIIAKGEEVGWNLLYLGALYNALCEKRSVFNIQRSSVPRPVTNCRRTVSIVLCVCPCLICACVLQLKSPLNLEQAASARDALSKAVYGRTFTWLVNKINVSLAYKVTHTCTNAPFTADPPFGMISLYLP